MKKEGLHVYILSNYGDWTYQRTKDNALDFLLLTDGDIFFLQCETGQTGCGNL